MKDTTIGKVANSSSNCVNINKSGSGNHTENNSQPIRPSIRTRSRVLVQDTSGGDHSSFLLGTLPSSISSPTTTTTTNSKMSDVMYRRFQQFINVSIYNGNVIRLVVLVVLSLQNSLFTVLRRYSQGVLKEDYSKYEVLLAGEVIKIIFSGYMIRSGIAAGSGPTSSKSTSKPPSSGEKVPLTGIDHDEEIELSNNGINKDTNHTNSSVQIQGNNDTNKLFRDRVHFIVVNSGKMFGLALIYGAMNILSFVSLRNIGAGMLTIFAQCKILTTATFSTILLGRVYTYTQWRALAALIAGVLLFSEPIWGKSDSFLSKNEKASVTLGTAAVIIEVTLSGFASIYFEKVIKLDPLELTIWERNFQLALVSTSFPSDITLHL